MKIRTIKEIENTEKDVAFTGGNSLRLILENDNMGFAFMKTIIPKGGPYFWHYPNHMEACFCISGNGVLTNIETNETHSIAVDTIYILDKHERHLFEAITDVVLISVFNPPLSGNESHDKNGNYPLSATANKELAKKIIANLQGVSNDFDAIEIVQDILNYKK